MLPDQVSNPEPLTYESGALPIALRGPAAWPSEQGVRHSRKESDGPRSAVGRTPDS